MSIRIHDSRAQAVVDFEPLEAGKVGMYVCGPTVQSSPHVGHLRSALVYDLWRRWFTYRGYDVTLVRNVTDIDDKILMNAGWSAEPGDGAVQDGGVGAVREPYWKLAYRVELEFTNGYNALGILPPTYEPRATASIPQMLEIIDRLIAAGHAYPAADGSGDVYFDVLSWPSYGALTRQSVDAMEAAADADPRGKRDPRDFALWKGQKPGEPDDASWASPWGAGRPGWHIECSAMSRRYLGPAFDIHGGGLDLRFPHHENELAQSTAAGDAFARYWVHNGLVNVEGQKMSKSLGNSIFASEFLALAPPMVVRYYLASAHYRSTIDYHDGALAEAQAALDRIRGFIERAERTLGDDRSGVVETVPDAFGAAMDDDLSVPHALAVLHDTVRSGNAAIDGGDVRAVASALGHVAAMLGVLGLDLATGSQPAGSDRALAQLVDGLLTDRASARAGKDFATADRIRDELTAAGIAIEDSAHGSSWRIEP